MVFVCQVRQGQGNDCVLHAIGEETLGRHMDDPELEGSLSLLHLASPLDASHIDHDRWAGFLLSCTGRQQRYSSKRISNGFAVQAPPMPWRCRMGLPWPAA